MRDIMDEVRKYTASYLELDGKRVALSAITADDSLRTKAIQTLMAEVRPYRNKDLPPEITTAWLTKLYLQAKDRADERQTVIEDMRRDLILGSLRNANFYLNL